MNKTNSSFQLVTYNILSSNLAEPSYFTKCNPEYLDNEYRYKKLIEKLDIEISNDCIICLQEISTSWAESLNQYFISRGYYMTTALYHSFLGVGIAIPLSEYNVENVDAMKIADTKSFEQKSINQYITGIFNYTFLSLFDRKPLHLYNQKVDPWEIALDQPNQLVSMELRHRASNTIFRVGTYHMPCLYKNRQVMVIQCALLAQYMQQLAKSKPYVLLGDFNLKPGESEYRLLTEGSLENDNTDIPKNIRNDNWKINVKPMKSAYKEFNGKEPEFTNYAQDVHQTEPFIGTLDYIFMSEEWKVQNVKPLLQLSECPGPLPLEHEPSDHLLIGATLTLDN